MKKAFLTIFTLVFLVILCVGANAESTVFVDGVGAANNSYATLAEAVTAVDEGGRVCLKANYATTAKAPLELPAKDFTLSAENGAVLTLGRAVFANGDLVLENITLQNGASSGTDFIYMNGHDLTVRDTVNTIPNASNGRYLTIFGGTSDPTVYPLTTNESDINLYGGDWLIFCVGNYKNAFTGTVNVCVDGARFHSVFAVGNYLSTGFSGHANVTVKSGSIVKLQHKAGTHSTTLCGGTVDNLLMDVTVAPEVDKTVTINTVTSGTVTKKAPVGYIVAQEGPVYSLKEDLQVKTVYLDGTGKTEGAFTNIIDALTSMPGGGTVVITGNTAISEDVVLPETQAVTFTSVYDGKDYTEAAALQISANVTLGGDTTFENVVVERVKNVSANYCIAAAGHLLTVEKTAIFLNYTGYQWLSIVGGTLSGTHTGGSHLVIKGGHYRNVFGGNYSGSFLGTSTLDITGGMFENAVCGGNYYGNFDGEVKLTFGGEACMLYHSTYPAGLIGGSLGLNKTGAYTFKGDIHLTVEGDAALTTNLIGGSKAKDITTEGDIYITIRDNVFIYYSVYAAGYTAPLIGNTKIVIEGGDTWGSIHGGSYASNMTGDSEIIITDGKLCYFEENESSSWPELPGTKNIYGGGSAGSTLTGNTKITVSGGHIFGHLIGGGMGDTAKVTGTSEVYVSGGEIVGSVGNSDITILDLSDGKSVSLGMSSQVDRLIGGGSLMIASNNLLTVGTLSGKVDLSINGLPLPKQYVAVSEMAEDAEIVYAVQTNEQLVKDGNGYAVDFEGACRNIEVTVYFYEGCSILTRVGNVYEGDFLTPVSSTSTSATYTLSPGLYNSTVIYTNQNNQRTYFYLDGRSATETVHVEFAKKHNTGYEPRWAANHTTQVMETYYDTSDIEGFHIPDSPYFKNRPLENAIAFTTDAEVAEFLKEKSESCDYMYVFYPGKTPVREIDYPVCIFTKDPVPEGATMEEIAEIVTQKEGREIIFITGGTHGCEPSGSEGALAVIGEMSGAYGEEIFATGHLGAVVVFPRNNPEGLYLYTRNADETADILNFNLNRDYMALSDVSSRTYISLYHQFMPTVTFDFHEAHAYPNISDGDLLSDVYDGGLSYYNGLFGPLANTKASAYGDLGASTEDVGENICSAAMARVREDGLRLWYYEKDPAVTYNSANSYALGALSFITEIPGMAAEGRYARRVYTHIALAKAVIGCVLESKGEVARQVAAARAALGISAQKYDPRRPIVMITASTRQSKYGIHWSNAMPAVDGTMRYPANDVWAFTYNVASRYRTLPTAYVIPADLTHIGEILSLLDRHGIAYYRLPKDQKLTLQRYGGTVSYASLEDAKETVFENGSYIIPVDGYRAYIISYLFEPDVTDLGSGVGAGAATLTTCAYLEPKDIYRSTESFIAAKLGLGGTYAAVDVPNGKTVASATVDGVLYTDVSVEDAKAFVVASDAEYYTVTLRFTDGTEESSKLGSRLGDMDHDYELGIRDVLLLIQAYLNNEIASMGDMDGDGAVSLLDVVKLLKRICG